MNWRGFDTTVELHLYAVALTFGVDLGVIDRRFHNPPNAHPETN
jgi:hypothetical protein